MFDISIKHVSDDWLEIILRRSGDQVPMAVLTVASTESETRLDVETPDAVRPNLVWRRRIDRRNDQVRTVVACDLVSEDEAILMDVGSPSTMRPERRILQVVTEETIADLYRAHTNWSDIASRLDSVREAFLADSGMGDR